MRRTALAPASRSAVAVLGDMLSSLSALKRPRLAQQRLVPFDGINLTQSGDSTAGLIAGAGADLQDPHRGPISRARSHSHNIWLADGLTAAMGSAVLYRPHTQRQIDENLRGQHSIADSTRASVMPCLRSVMTVRWAVIVDEC